MSAGGAFEHASIMVEEVVSFVAPRAGGFYADATLGGGGHAEALLEASNPDGRLLGLDRDPDALAAARARLARFGERVTFLHARFSDLRSVMYDLQVDALNGLIADLGVSSPQLDHADRGFSFAEDGPLDMRMDPTTGQTARELIAELGEGDLADLIYELGEERRSRSIARSIRRAHEQGDLETTQDLRRAIIRAVGPRRGRIDPATRTFQALRLAVNQELDELDTLLESLPDVLAEGGVAAIISFHSLEDRRVKHAFRDNPRLSPLTKKPCVASDEERARNPRSRSAKLRAARYGEVAA